MSDRPTSPFGFSKQGPPSREVFGYPIRESLSPEETAFFKTNPTVTGMAAQDKTILLNPFSTLSPEARHAVAQNEASRLYMREMKIAPQSPLTPQQRTHFMGTPYEGNEETARQSIIGRIISGDPSAGDVTNEQRQEAARIHQGLRSRVPRVGAIPQRPTYREEDSMTIEAGRGYRNVEGPKSDRFLHPLTQYFPFEKTWYPSLDEAVSAAKLRNEKLRETFGLGQK